MKVPRAWIGLALAFGAGALISSVAFELTEVAFASGGFGILAVGLTAGAFTYFAGNWWLKHRAGAPHGTSGAARIRGPGTLDRPGRRPGWDSGIDRARAR